MQTARPEDPPPVAAERYLLLALAALRLALPLSAVREVLPLPRLAVPPGLPPVVAGFADLGASPLPVLRTGRLLGVETVEPADEHDGLYRHIVLLPGHVGLLVDRVLDLVAAGPGALRPVDPARTLQGCVAAMLLTPQGPAHLLDPDRLLLARERAELAELAAAAAARAQGWVP